jgi:ADP-heptose:LPS heptosyltransferase
VLPTLGIEERTRSLVWNVSGDERREALLRWRELGYEDGQPVIAFIPTGGYTSKKWPAERYAELASGGLLDPAYRYLVFWGSDQERREAEQIAAMGGPSIRVAPRMNLRQTAALLQRCTAAVGNDSGPTHIATALGIAVVIPYGPSDEHSHGPWSDRARVVTAEDRDERCCRRTDCLDPVCMTGIGAERMAEALIELLARNAVHRPG